MDRLGTLDAEFLHLEDGIEHMHIAGACIFKGVPPDFAQVRSLIESKLHLIPRYRQRVRTVPFELGRPVWVDDPHFDIGYHLRHTALPKPGDVGAFRSLMGRLMSIPLDRDRPLWEAWLVEELAGKRWGLVFKVHHCMVDGVAGVQLLGALLDIEPSTDVGEKVLWSPTAEPGGLTKVLDAWGGLATDAATAAIEASQAVLKPVDSTRALLANAQGLTRLLGGSGSKNLSIEGDIGPHRSWAHSSVSLKDVKAIGKKLGGTVNDVVLAALSGAYRDLLISRGDDADTATLRTLVPVSTRHDDGEGIPDNRVSAILFEMPVHLDDPVERLRATRKQMGDLKQSHMAEAGEAIVNYGDLLPPMVVGTFTRGAAKALRSSQHVINTVTTNVPGPQFPLYCLGSEMLEYRPFVPIAHGIRVATAILSYNGSLFFGVTGDYALAEGVDVVATGVVGQIDLLREISKQTPPA